MAAGCGGLGLGLGVGVETGLFTPRGWTKWSGVAFLALGAPRLPQG